MKLMMLSLLVLAIGCDTPTRSRFPNSTSVGGDAFTTTPGGTTTTPTTPTTTTTTPGFQNCNLTSRSSSADIGNVAVCKSSSDETVIQFVTSLTNTDSRVCLVPMYNNDYLGDPQCTYTTAEKVMTGRLYKYSNYSGVPINGVTVLKETLLVDFFGCQDAYKKYIQYYCPANPNYAPCVQGATNYRTSMCNYFSQKYPNTYVRITF